MKLRFPYSLRWKLWIGAVTLVGVPLLLLNQRYIRNFDSFTRKTLQLHMHNYASVVSQQYLLHVSPSPGDVSLPRSVMTEQISRLADKTASRIRIYNTETNIYYDSEPGKELPVINNSIPEEITDALKGGWSAQSRLSQDRKYYYYFLAQPIKDRQKNVRGVTYIITHTGPIIAEIMQMVKQQRITLAVMLAIATLASLLFGWAVTHRLRKLIKAARIHATGKSSLNLDLKGHDEIAELAVALKNMARELDERYIYNHDFIRELFHEISTPIHAIQGAVDYLLNKEEYHLTTEQSDELLATLKQSSDRLEILTGDLKKRSRLDASRILGEKKQVDIESFLKNSISQWETAHRRPHAAIRLFPPVTPLRISIIPHRIEQVITNLIENAVQHTPESGHITIKVASLHTNWIRIEVEDTGCGISASSLDRVFDRFYTTRHKNGSGTGLGLDIAKMFVLQHKGRISVDSIEGEGSAFYVDLPCS